MTLCVIVFLATTDELKNQFLPGAVRSAKRQLVHVACSDFVICATGSTDRLNPFGPFNVDYQVWTSSA